MEKKKYDFIKAIKHVTTNKHTLSAVFYHIYQDMEWAQREVPVITNVRL